MSLTLEELVQACGLTAKELGDLERYGLLSGRPVAGQVYYDGEALLVAQLAAGFAAHGVEPRHLRLYKNSAEREAGFYEQLVLPLVKQRNPAARRQARDKLGDLARMGDRLRGALLRQALRDHTDL